MATDVERIAALEALQKGDRRDIDKNSARLSFLERTALPAALLIGLLGAERIIGLF